MPFDPVQVYGALHAFDRQEFAETGLLTETVSFTPEQEIKQKKMHRPEALGQIGQVQVWKGSLAIEVKGGIVPNAQGVVHGLPAGYVGTSVTTCAHFAALPDGSPEGAAAVARHGYTRDPSKLLMLESAKTDLGEEAASVTLGMRYFPHVSKEQLALPG